MSARVSHVVYSVRKALLPPPEFNTATLLRQRPNGSTGERDEPNGRAASAAGAALIGRPKRKNRVYVSRGTTLSNTRS
jgi:hypothetical protein